jgi:hypothetical protein
MADDILKTLREAMAWSEWRLTGAGLDYCILTTGDLRWHLRRCDNEKYASLWTMWLWCDQHETNPGWDTVTEDREEAKARAERAVARWFLRHARLTAPALETSGEGDISER